MSSVMLNINICNVAFICISFFSLAIYFLQLPEWPPKILEDAFTYYFPWRLKQKFSREPHQQFLQSFCEL